MEKLVNAVNNAESERTTAYFKYLRTITTISTGFLGLLIGLKPENIPDCTAKYLFLATISLIGLGVFFSVIAQYYEVSYTRQRVSAASSMLSKYVENDGAEFLEIIKMNKSKTYIFSETMTFVCLALAVFTLISYVFFLEL